jgi:hypothetical protein
LYASKGSHKPYPIKQNTVDVKHFTHVTADVLAPSIGHASRS